MRRARSGFRSGRSDFRRFDAIEFRKILLKIHVPLIRNFVLMIRGLVRVAAIEALNYIHARDNLAEWSEALAAVIERSIFAQVDEDLRRARIRTARLRERDRSRG